MPYVVEMSGVTFTQPNRRGERTPVRCFARFTDAREHDSLVEQHFRDYLEYDIPELRRVRTHHFTAPHNIARALLQYKSFRPRGEYFDDHGCDDSLDETRLPERQPEVHSDTYDLWIESPQIA
jgi:hypothetical protein